MNRKFKATIITPFHNTDLAIFRTTYESLLKQTIGFENIEWIIVLHNCSREYIDGVKELVKGHSNVFLKELFNSAGSASSPRNYGLQFVTSPYIEFLDSDDTISENTVETCVSEMEKLHPDIVVFRMAYVRQNESVISVITDVTLWNPLEEEIVLTGEETTSRPELYSTINFCTHNRFFDASFLKEHNFRFDEDITMAEDAFFTLSCYTAARKIVVLPQFIGHSYFVNSKSAVQSMNKKPEAVLHFSYGFSKMFDLLLEHHAYYNHFFLTILQAYIYYAICSPGFTAENWKQLQDDMRPYAELVTVPPVNKFFTKEEGKRLYDFVTRYILSPVSEIMEDSKSFQNGEQFLLGALRKNEGTDFADYYHFEKITTIDEYRKAVPLQSYKDYAKLVELSETVGESKLISNDSIEGYAGVYSLERKGISLPMTSAVCRSLGDDFIQKCKGEVTFLAINDLPKRTTVNDGGYEDSLAGIIIRNAVGSISISSVREAPVFPVPFELLFSDVGAGFYYLNILEALRCRELTRIYSANTLLLCNFLNMLEYFKEDLCRDIENGTISHGSRLDPGNERWIANLKEKDPERAEELRNAFEKDKKDILPAIWPKLNKVIAGGSGAFELYTDKISEWFERVPFAADDLITPFGIIGRGCEGTNEYTLVTDRCFYEFIPLHSAGRGKTLLLKELSEGETYELVVTNEHGIYRLATGIFIKPTEVSDQEIRFREVKKPLIVNDRVMLETDTVERALCRTFGNLLGAYYYSYDEKNNCLDMIVVVPKPDDEKGYAARIDKNLCEEALSSEKETAAGLGPCHLYMAENRNLNLIWEDLRERCHLGLDGFRPDPCLSRESFSDLLGILNRAKEKEG